MAREAACAERCSAATSRLRGAWTWPDGLWMRNVSCQEVEDGGWFYPHVLSHFLSFLYFVEWECFVWGYRGRQMIVPALTSPLTVFSFLFAFSLHTLSPFILYPLFSSPFPCIYFTLSFLIPFSLRLFPAFYFFIHFLPFHCIFFPYFIPFSLFTLPFPYTYFFSFIPYSLFSWPFPCIYFPILFFIPFPLLATLFSFIWAHLRGIFCSLL